MVAPRKMKIYKRYTTSFETLENPIHMVYKNRVKVSWSVFECKIDFVVDDEKKECAGYVMS
jgi:hypothetical protein